ncbi:DUF6273 domain-containing protein [Lactococcus petauri]|uniref:DUF6273 domain-containing protein n=1 Tax=Lactococcus petauri TaxID=1940789 RepID=UPI003853CBB3
MSPEKKQKLRNIVLLALLGLIGGTFAFTAFNQQIINDRANNIETNVTGRVHDYYNRDTDNKDVFVENYGHDVEANPIMVRIRLSEYMEIQRRGEDNPAPLVDTAERGNISTWTIYLPEEVNINQRRGEDSSRFNRYSNLTFGRAGTAPWYMPTFNHDILDLRSAAAGDARDFLADGATHPGDGTENYWTESGERSSYDNTNGRWPSEAIEQDTKQHLQEDRPPMTIEQWSALTIKNRVGNYWVIDHNTGWAYWANLLEQGQATSYLLDAANMTDEVVTSIVNGSYYYAIHVDSQAISSVNMDRFLVADTQGNHDTRLAAFLEGVKNGFYGEDGNPPANENNPPSEFQFHLMSPGRLFRMWGHDFRYLENMGNGNHMIIRNEVMNVGTAWSNQNTVLNNWYTNDIVTTVPGIRAQREQHIAPVASSFPTDPTDLSALLPLSQTNRESDGTISNLSNFAVPYGDRTVVVPDGEKRAFALSVADVNHLTYIGSFSSVADRGANSTWWLRTPATSTQVWLMGDNGMWHQVGTSGGGRGVRPPLIIHQ